ncbi:uncharacterized protein F4807DRAFT_271942 [Annulohypoxylon truncatum]|uniref:uncharacterized protein n=1 Tax=Annulohypoxylon truncatum TaxID=327061 RepID=UPI002007D403|nr:uncharacterized protein F4807DRAFT_271942 [Annulohypoxylon truncatum]KAI1205695.1 hypothetical protein F4807DRAFT_271942 [Annulohypoxylon truncatum]
MPDEKITILGYALFQLEPVIGEPSFMAQHPKGYSSLSAEVKAIKQEDPTRAVIILTHLFPDRAYRANDPTLGPLESSNVKLWAFGNSQCNFDYEEMPGKRVFCNQRRRIKRLFPDFDMGRVVEVTPPIEKRLPALEDLSPSKNATTGAPKRHKLPDRRPRTPRTPRTPRKNIGNKESPGS